MTAKEITVRSEFENLGFVETDTGGGCTAWVMALSHGRVVLVANEGGMAPSDMGDPALLGVCPAGVNEALCFMEFANARTLLDWIDALCGDGESAATAIARWAGGQ